MAQAATPFPDSATTPSAQAALVLGITASAWRLASRSPQSLARRAAYGYVPRRVRLRAAAAMALRPAFVGLAHSW